jgi:hypothetical protein
MFDCARPVSVTNSVTFAAVAGLLAAALYDIPIPLDTWSLCNTKYVPNEALTSPETIRVVRG